RLPGGEPDLRLDAAGGGRGHRALTRCRRGEVADRGCCQSPGQVYADSTRGEAGEVAGSSGGSAPVVVEVRWRAGRGGAGRAGRAEGPARRGAGPGRGGEAAATPAPPGKSHPGLAQAAPDRRVSRRLLTEEVHAGRGGGDRRAGHQGPARGLKETGRRS